MSALLELMKKNVLNFVGRVTTIAELEKHVSVEVLVNATSPSKKEEESLSLKPRGRRLSRKKVAMTAEINKTIMEAVGDAKPGTKEYQKAFKSVRRLYPGLRPRQFGGCVVMMRRTPEARKELMSKAVSSKKAKKAAKPKRTKRTKVRSQKSSNGASATLTVG